MEKSPIIKLSYAKDVTSPGGLVVKEYDLASFIREFATPIITDGDSEQDKKSVPCYNLAIFKDNYRNDENAILFTGCAIDLDNLGSKARAMIRTRLSKKYYFAHTTHSHLAPGKGHRWRVVVLYPHPVGPEKQRLAMKYLYHILGGDLNAASLSQPAFVASAPDNRKDNFEWFHTFSETDSEWFDPLADVPDMTMMENKFIYHDGSAMSLMDVLKTVAQPVIEDDMPEVLAEAEEVLSYIDPDLSRDEWVKVGAGLHHHFDGAPEGLELFIQWSSGGAKYQGPEDCRARWDSFQRDLGPRVCTFKSVCDMARAGGADLSAIARKHGTMADEDPLEGDDVEGDDGDACMLDKYDLTDNLAELESQLRKECWVLGQMALMGQATVFYAAPNTGKTLLTLYLLIQSVKSGSIEPSDVYYVNADDNHAGLTQKLKLAKEYGFKTLSPGYNGFKAKKLQPLLEKMASKGQANGKIIILDTLKKFTNLMDKNVASSFTNAMREFVSKGGTVIMLAHVNKHKDVEGKSIYQGTSDMVDDVDCAYKIELLQQDGDQKLVQFENFKDRGNMAQTATFEYSAIGNYKAKLLSVVEVEDAEATARVAQGLIQQQLDDNAERIQAVLDYLQGGPKSQSDIVRHLHAALNLSRRQTLKLLNQHDGPDYQAGNRWYTERGMQNSLNYHVLGSCHTWDD